MMIENNNSNNKDYLKNFSVATKLSWLSGYDLWSLRSTIPIATRPTSTTPPREIPPIRLSDGPHGIRKPIHEKDIQNTYPATCFPSACSLACSWNPKLLETSVGRTLQKECLYYNIDVLLGPGINIKRHPYGGRNHEYFSEDPYLTGKLAQSLIYGIQQSSSSSSISSTSTACIDDKNVDNNNNNNDESNTTTTPNVVVGACLKHFALNNQETYRMIIDVVCDERTIRELYLPAFEMCISSDHPSSHCYNNKQKSSNNANDMIADYQPPKMIMGAYNKLNGRYSCENTWLLQKVLRREWNFQNTNGLVVSDWGAINDRIDSIIAGTDLEMPGPSAPTGVFDYEILQTIQEQQQEQQTNSNSSNSREELLGTTAVAVAATTTTTTTNPTKLFPAMLLLHGAHPNSYTKHITAQTHMVHSEHTDPGAHPCAPIQNIPRRYTDHIASMHPPCITRHQTVAQPAMSPHEALQGRHRYCRAPHLTVQSHR